MDPLTLSLLISGGTSLIKGGVGLAQTLRGSKLAKSAIRPKYNIPSSVNEYLSNARANSVRGLPGQDLMEQKLGASTASGIRQAEQGASSSAALMAAIAGLKGSEQSGLTDIGIQSAGYRDANQQRLQEALLKYGDYQDKEFEMNQQKPFEDKAAAAQALKGSGLQNIMTGIEGIAGAASLYGKPSGSVTDPLTGLPITKQKGGLGFENKMDGRGLTSRYADDKRRGAFKGSYRDWITSKGMDNSFNFNNQLF